MRKALVVLLVTVMVSAAAWAQKDVMLGPHNTNDAFGCQSCHTPHSAVLAGDGLYLWAVNQPSGTYTTYGGGTLTANLQSGVKPTDTQAHTVLCLSCHDSVFNTAMSQTPGSTGGPSVYSISSPIAVGSSGALKAGHSQMVTVNGGVVGAGNDLSANHPVHVLYPNGSALASTAYDQPTILKFWKAVKSGNTGMSFSDDGSIYSYGHSVRLFSTDGQNAYVECGSCHNPHAQTQTIVKVAGVNKAVTTAHFLRGQYTTAQDISGFCMSCHADKSAAWDGTGNQ